MNLLIQGRSGTTPETSRNAFGSNQGTNEDDTQSDPHREASILRRQTTQNSGPEVGQDMVIGVHEDVIYWSFSKSSGKRKKNRSTSQPQFRNENTLRRLKQTKFCWPFSSWQTTKNLQISIALSTEIPNCQNRSPQRCQHLAGNLRSSNRLNIFSMRASKFIIT